MSKLDIASFIQLQEIIENGQTADVISSQIQRVLPNFGIHSIARILIFALQVRPKSFNILYSVIQGLGEPEKAFVLNEIVHRSNPAIVYNFFCKGIIPLENIIERFNELIQKTQFEGNNEKWIFQWISYFGPELESADAFNKFNYQCTNESINNIMANKWKLCKEQRATYFLEPALIFIQQDDEENLQNEIMKLKTQPDFSIDHPFPFHLFEIWSDDTEFMFTYLGIAALYGSFKCFDLLMKQGASLKESHDAISPSITDLAAYGGNLEIIKLIEETKVNDFKRVAHFALYGHQKILFEYFVNEKHASLTSLSRDKLSPAHYAAKTNFIWGLKYLADQQANLSIKTHIGLPIHIAAKNGSNEMIQILIARKCKISDTNSPNKVTRILNRLLFIMLSDGIKLNVLNIFLLKIRF